MQFHGQKLQGKIQFPPSEIERRKQFLEAIKDGYHVIEDLKVLRQPKSDKQVKTHWGLLVQSVIAQANDLGIDVSDFLVFLLDDRIPKGQGLTTDFLHELFYVIAPTTDEDGRRITLSKMNTEQASNLFERVRNILAPLEINVENPNKDWRNDCK